MPEILDPLIAPVPPSLQPRPAPAATRQQLLDGQRAFGMAQQLFAGSPEGVSRSVETSWYGSASFPESGCFARVRTGAGLDDLIGEVIRVTAANRSVLVYVIEAANVLSDLALARRPFAAISRLSVESIQCDVVTVR